jgi:hypothetical protein
VKTSPDRSDSIGKPAGRERDQSAFNPPGRPAQRPQRKPGTKIVSQTDVFNRQVADTSATS